MPLYPKKLFPTRSPNKGPRLISRVFKTLGETMKEMGTVKEIAHSPLGIMPQEFAPHFDYLLPPLQCLSRRPRLNRIFHGIEYFYSIRMHCYRCQNDERCANASKSNPRLGALGTHTIGHTSGTVSRPKPLPIPSLRRASQHTCHHPHDPNARSCPGGRRLINPTPRVTDRWRPADIGRHETRRPARQAHRDMQPPLGAPWQSRVTPSDHRQSSLPIVPLRQNVPSNTAFKLRLGWQCAKPRYSPTGATNRPRSMYS